MTFLAKPSLALIRASALGLCMALAAGTGAQAADGKIAVVAAENFYGDIAQQIGGDRVAVISIMNNPDQDPHLFETTPGVVRQIAGADIAIVNGADYDPWMEKLIQAAPHPGRVVISAAALTGKKSGDNPHLWYDPATMPAVAKALAAAFKQGRRRPCRRLSTRGSRPCSPRSRASIAGWRRCAPSTKVRR